MSSKMLRLHREICHGCKVSSCLYPYYHTRLTCDELLESEAIQQHTGLAHPQAVRFSSVNQEIEPVHSLGTNSTITVDDPSSYEELSATAQAEIRSLSASLHTARLQQTNSRHFAFEPVSLPASRVREVFFGAASCSQGYSITLRLALFTGGRLACYVM